MKQREEIDHFRLLEEKVESLIKFITSLRQEKESLKEKNLIHEEKIAALTTEMEDIKDARDEAKGRIVSLIEKIEQLDI